MTGPDVELVPFEAGLHGELLEGWLQRPHVVRWWGDPAESQGSMPEPGPQSGRAMIVLDGSPVGYLHWQPYGQGELEEVGIADVPPGAIDVDLMIAESDALGRGVGSRALELIAERLLADPQVPLVGLGTSMENERAIRAYERAGFRRRRRFLDPEWGPCWFMIRER